MTRSFTALYRASIKSDESDELVNTFLQRPVAGVITYIAALLPISPNQVTLLSTLSGIAGGVALMVYPPAFTAAALLLYLKDILDSVDGQLARATTQFSRRGRFYDSLGDFAVNLVVFAGICLALIGEGTPPAFALFLSLAGFVCVNLRVSYQVFYQTSYLHYRGAYAMNRVSEELRHEDRDVDTFTLLLQRMFLVLYGWQDRFVAALDARCRAQHGDPPAVAWFTDRTGLSFNRFFGMGTEFVALTVCCAVGSLHAYVLATLIGFNALWGAAIVYRFFFALRNSSSMTK
jgi:phosphatidylglycerophosphate synthase